MLNIFLVLAHLSLPDRTAERLDFCRLALSENAAAEADLPRPLTGDLIYDAVRSYWSQATLQDTIAGCATAVLLGEFPPGTTLGDLQTKDEYRQKLQRLALYAGTVHADIPEDYRLSNRLVMARTATLSAIVNQLLEIWGSEESSSTVLLKDWCALYNEGWSRVRREAQRDLVRVQLLKAPK